MSRQTDVERQKERILKAALDTFSATGYVGTNVSTIAKEAGVSYGLVHHYFGSKEKLLISLVESGLAYLQDSRQQAISNGDTPAQKLRSWIYSMTYAMSESDAFQKFSRLIMQFKGAPEIHPKVCLEVLDRFTETEINQLYRLLTDLKDEDEAFHTACLAFNTVFGSRMFGQQDQHYLQLLYETGCYILGIPDDPVPDSMPMLKPSWVLNER